MPYPSRPVLEALPEFQGTATVRQSAEQRARLVTFSAEQYRAGRSLRQIAELTDRSQTVLCTCQARCRSASLRILASLLLTGLWLA
mgnify:FL=1